MINISCYCYTGEWTEGKKICKTKQLVNITVQNRIIYEPKWGL